MLQIAIGHQILEKVLAGKVAHALSARGTQVCV